MLLRSRFAPTSLIVALVGSLAGCGAEPCTVVDNDDGTHTLTCPDGTKTTIADGDNGEDGETGTNGADGDSCTVTDNDDGTKTISCTDGTSVVVTDGDAVFGNVIGIVLPPGWAEPLEGTAVSLVNEEDGAIVSTTTDEQGTYGFTNVRAGVYTLEAARDGYDVHRVANVFVSDGVTVAPLIRLVRAAYIGDFRASYTTVSADGSAAAWAEGSVIFRFDRERGTRVIGANLTTPRFANDARYLVAFDSSQNGYVAYNAETDTLHPMFGNTLYIEEDGAHAITASDTAVSRFDLATGAETVITESRASNGSFFGNEDGVVFVETNGAGMRDVVAFRYSDGRREVLVGNVDSSFLGDPFRGPRLAFLVGGTVIIVDLRTTPFSVQMPSTTAIDLYGMTDDSRYAFVRENGNTMRIFDLDNDVGHTFGGGHANVDVATEVPTFASTVAANVNLCSAVSGSATTTSNVGSVPMLTRDGSVLIYRDGNSVRAQRAAPESSVLIYTFNSAPTVVLNGDETLGVAAELGAFGAVSFDLATLMSSGAPFAVTALLPLTRHIAMTDGFDAYAIRTDATVDLGNSPYFTWVGGVGLVAASELGGGLFAFDWFDDETGTVLPITGRGTGITGSGPSAGVVLQQYGDCAGCTDDGMFLFTDPDL